MVEFLKRNLILIVSLVTAGIVTSLGIIFEPAKLLYNPDEVFVTDSSLFLIYGITPKNLEWPAIPLVVFLYVCSLIKVFFEIIFNSGSLENFNDVFRIIDKQTYNYLLNPFPWVKFGRIVSAAVTLFVSFFSFRHILRIDSIPKEARYFLLIGFITTPIIVLTSWELRPDSIAHALWVFLCIRLSFPLSDSKKLRLVNLFLYSLILSLRFAYLPGIVLLLGFELVNTDLIVKNRIKRAFISLVFICLFFIVLCPFVYTDTIAFAKAFLGNFFSKQAGSSSGINWNYILDFLSTPTGLFLSLLVTGSVLTARKVTGGGKLIVLIITILLFLYPASKLNIIYDRYFIFSLPLTMILAAICFGQIFSKVLQFKFKSIVAYCLLASLVILNTITFSDELIASHKPRNFTECVKWVEENIKENESIVADAIFQNHFDQNDTALARITKLLSDPTMRINKLNETYSEITGNSMSGHSLIMENNFFDEENILSLKVQLLRKYYMEDETFGPKYDITFFKYNSRRIHFLSSKMAEKQFLNKKAKVYIGADRIEGLEPSIIFDKVKGPAYYLYSNQE